MIGKSVATFWAITAATTASAQAGQTAQDAFNTAQAAYAKGDWATAADRYRAALRLMNAKSRSVPVVRARLASSLFNRGEAAAALTEAHGAIAQFGALGIAQDEDLAAAHMLVADLARRDLDSAAAIAAYRRAIAAAAEPNKAIQIVNARAGMALAAMTSDPAAAAAALDEAIADPGYAALPRPRQADLLAMRARAALNLGDAKAAGGFINRALDMMGRTTTKVSLAQVAMRGDAALIYAKLGDHEKVRQFLTYSGAGHLPDNGWLNRARSDLPVCDADIRPDDMAVVEFAIDANGRTLGAAAVYASRPGPIGDAFARSVRTWRWRAADVSKLDLFWRSSVRVELRCITRPPGIKLADAFRDATEQWLATQGVTADLSDPTLNAGPSPSTPAQRIVAGLAGIRDASKPAAFKAAATDLYAALEAADPPADVRAYVVQAAPVQFRSDQRRPPRTQVNEAIAALQMRKDGARAAAWLRTELALRSETAGDFKDAHGLWADVAAVPAAAMPADDPIRTVALLHLSLLDKMAGRHADADSRLVAAGMSADQCSLLDVQPLARNMSISSSAFPAEALRWGFEGTVREAFDINADGSVAGVRTVIAYPPLVFGAATETAVKKFRYAIPTLGDKPLGCAAHTQNVRYVL